MNLRLPLVLLCATMTSTAFSVGLVKDINTVPVGEYSGGADFSLFATVAQGTLYRMDDGIHGAELWISDGTPGGTRLVKDIRPGPESSSIEQLTTVAGVGYFFADDGANGYELWRSNGTEAGTSMVANIGPGANGYGGGITLGRSLPTLNGVMYFGGTDASGEELWRSDGTASGTYRLSSITPGADSTYLNILFVAGNHVFFYAEDSTGPQLWATDGTSAGTRRVTNFPAGTAFRWLTVAGNTLYFTHDDRTHGEELWRVGLDGRNLGMVVDLNDMVVGLSGETMASEPSGLFAVGGTLIFAATTMTGLNQPNGVLHHKLYRLAAGSSTPQAIMDIQAGTFPENPIAFDNGAIFQLLGPGNNLWVTDGTVAGTQNLAPVNFEIAQVPAAVRRGGEAFFFARTIDSAPSYDLWHTDGTAAGTHVVQEFDLPTTAWDMVDFNGRLYFAMTSPDTGRELWSTDGTTDGTHIVKDVMPGEANGDPVNLAVSGGRLFFAAFNADFTREPWVTDGTEANTTRLAAITTHFANKGSDPDMLGRLGNEFFFTANDGAHGPAQLWASDGTTANTRLVKDLVPAGQQAYVYGFMPMNGIALFVASDETHGTEVWRTDGTANGTYRVKDINPGPGDGTRLGLGPTGAVLNGVAYFEGDDGVHGPELWRTDGTEAGTWMVIDLSSDQRGTVVLPATANGRVFFTLPGDPPTIYSTDGTEAGTVVLSSALNIMSFDNVVSFQNRVCFGVLMPSQDSELYCSTGAAGDATKVTDLAAQGLHFNHQQLVNGKLLVTAVQRGGTGGGLYVSDGTIAGLSRISDEYLSNDGVPFADGSRHAYVQLNGASTDIIETDGTAAGTHSMLAGSNVNRAGIIDVYSGFGNSVVFVVLDSQKGPVLWETDGSPAGTRYLVDVNPVEDQQDVAPHGFIQMDSRLFFAAYRSRVGVELWALYDGFTNAVDDYANAEFNSAVAIDALANDGGFAAGSNSYFAQVVTPPASGTAVFNSSTGTITYTPNAGFSGLDTFTYRVGDGADGFSNPAYVQVTVAPAVVTTPPGTAPNPPSGGGGGAGGGGGSGGGGGGALGWEVLLLALSAMARVMRDLRRRAHAASCAATASRMVCDITPKC